MILLLSLNAWRGENWDGRESHIHAAAGAFSFKLNGQRVITNLGLLFVGIATWVVALVGLIAL